ncbi:hypothetical protein HAX54_030596 [Datura stramonium]|uniref:Uncharacterized protein n=1 Tax=Datura stramonium TaxID=4076 RepID=A0ABS8VAA1_DATST|nr:hypothetical protein [Datura stramonium]
MEKDRAEKFPNGGGQVIRGVGQWLPTKDNRKFAKDKKQDKVYKNDTGEHMKNREKISTSNAFELLADEGKMNDLTPEKTHAQRSNSATDLPQTVKGVDKEGDRGLSNTSKEGKKKRNIKENGNTNSKEPMMLRWRDRVEDEEEIEKKEGKIILAVSK